MKSLVIALTSAFQRVPASFLKLLFMSLFLFSLTSCQLIQCIYNPAAAEISGIDCPNI